MTLPLRGASPVLAALRLVAAVTVPPLLLTASFARRSPSIFTLVATVLAMVLFIGAQVVGVKVGPLGAAGLVLTLITSGLVFRAVRHAGGLWIAGSLVGVAALALDWIAFDWYWAIPLVIVAASAGLGLAERRTRTP